MLLAKADTSPAYILVWNVVMLSKALKVCIIRIITISHFLKVFSCR